MRHQLSVVGIALQSIDLAAVAVNKTIRSTQSSNAFPVQEFKFTDARFPGAFQAQPHIISLPCAIRELSDA